MREDILGALKSGLIRGETLKKAMMTLYNTGYKKNEIEEAAAELQKIIQQQSIETKQITSSQPIQQPVQTNFEKPKSKIKIILIIFLLIILMGMLVGVFLFRAELIEFFNGLFN